MEKDVIQERVWNTKQVITAILITMSLTFTVSMIWARFLYVETAVKIVDSRYKKITDRLIIRVERLEESGSDSK